MRCFWYGYWAKSLCRNGEGHSLPHWDSRVSCCMLGACKTKTPMATGVKGSSALTEPRATSAEIDSWSDPTPLKVRGEGRSDFGICASSREQRDMGARVHTWRAGDSVSVKTNSLAFNSCCSVSHRRVRKPIQGFPCGFLAVNKNAAQAPFATIFFFPL